MYKVIFRDKRMGFQFVLAASVEIQGEHLVFFDADGMLAALFLREIVESWSLAHAGTA